MKPKTRGPALNLKQWRDNHEKNKHRTYYDAKVNTWHIHRCGGCSSKFYVLPEHHPEGQDAIGEEWLPD